MTQQGGSVALPRDDPGVSRARGEGERRGGGRRRMEEGIGGRERGWEDRGREAYLPNFLKL